MTNFIIRKFINNYENTGDISTRESYGVVASLVGIICNIFLFAVKLIIGILIKSVSITADSVNNLSDASSSIISFFGFKMANKPADEEHPFGHGRIEYLTALIVSFFIILLGYEFLKSAIAKIIEPNEIIFNAAATIILVFTCPIKVWLGFFYKKLAKAIDSKPLYAVSQDSFNDVIITLSTIISILISKFTGFNIDGYVGVIVAGILLYSGYSLSKETLSQLLGESSPREFAVRIKQRVESYEGIIGTHDLIVHNYGPGRFMATIHAEVLNTESIEKCHLIIDKIERDIFEEMGIFLTIHMDPTSVNDENILNIKNTVFEILNKHNKDFNAHDFRLVNSGAIINVIFDIEIPYDQKKNELTEILQIVKKSVKNIDERYNTIINIENPFIRRA